ncbi:MAG: radical SAM peptide maturase [Bacteroidota bacterium]
MRAATPFTTSSGNTYFYSSHNRQFIHSHPLINYFLDLHQNSLRWKAFLGGIKTDKTLEIPGLGKFDQAEVQYYLSKFRFYKKHGFFKPGPLKNRSGLIPKNRIEQNLARTKQVIFETTEDCNLDCVYCTYSKFYFNKTRDRSNIRTEDALKLLALLLEKRKANTDQQLAVSFYGGEPLKNFGFIETIVNFIEKNKSSDLNIKYSMTTNGLLLKKYIGFLAEKDFELAISLDGDDFANSFRVLKTNKKPSFLPVSRNIEMVRKNYPDYFDRRVIFLTVRHNRNSLKSIYEYFSSNFGKTPITSSITTTGVVEEFRDEFEETFVKTDVPAHEDNCYIHEMFTRHPFVSETSELFERFGNFVYRKPKQLLNPLTSHRDSRKYIPTATCSPFELRIYMSADGGIYPCEHISRIFELGKVKDATIDIDPKKITTTYNTYFQKIKKLCDQCYLSDNCKECIFNTGVEKGVPVCEFFMNKHKFSAHLSQIFNYLEKDQKLFVRIRDEAFLPK